MKKITQFSFLFFSVMLMSVLGVKAQGTVTVFHETFDNLTTENAPANALTGGLTDEDGYGGINGTLLCSEDASMEMAGSRFKTKNMDLTGDNVVLHVTYKSKAGSTGTKKFQIALDKEGTSGVNGVLNEAISASPTTFTTKTFVITGGTASSFIHFRIESSTSVIIDEIKVTKDASASTTYALTLTNENGTVAATNASGQAISNLTQIAEDDVVTLTAAPNRGYAFESWSGDASGTANPTTVTMTADKSVTANFSALTARTVTADVDASGCTDGVIAEVAGNADGLFYDGDEVTFTATNSATCSFVEWSDGNTDATRAVTIDGDLALTATFESYADVTAPTLSSISPTDGATITLPSGTTTGTQTVTLTFDEAIQVVGEIKVNGVAVTPSVSGAEVTFDVDVVADETYEVVIAADAVEDIAGNPFAGDSFSFDVVEAAASAYLYELNEADYSADGFSMPSWISPVAGAYSVTSFSSFNNRCTTSGVENVLSGAKDGLKFTLPKAGKISVDVTVSGNTRTVTLGTTTATISREDCVKTLEYVVNSCDPVEVVLSCTSTLGIVAIRVTDVTCHTLTVDECENGRVEVDPVSESGLYAYGTELTLNAIPSNGFLFESWTGHAAQSSFSAYELGSGDNHKVIVTGDMTVGATFKVDDANSIENSIASKAVTSVKQYSVTGVEVSDDAKGVVIVKTTYNDGSVETTKKLVK